MASQARPYIGINLTSPAQRTPGRSSGCTRATSMPSISPAVCRSSFRRGSRIMSWRTLLDRIDGIVLTGCGHDMDPKKMGLPTHPAVTPMPSRREDADRLLTQIVIDRQMPVLAVAVGMHESNVLSGGSIFMHLPEDLPKALPHKDISGGPHRHIVLLEPGTRVDAIYGGGEIRVNSYHHQAIQNVAPGFRISAKSPDGIIEAIESEDDGWFAVGVQWHPHSETASALDMQLFESFLQACAKQEMRLQLAA